MHKNKKLACPIIVACVQYMNIVTVHHVMILEMDLDV